MTDDMDAAERARIIDALAGDSLEAREHLESLDDGALSRLLQVGLQVATGDLRHVTLPDGTGALIDPNSPHTDEEIIDALRDDTE